MATVNYRNGRAEVRFYDQSGVRRTLALGKIAKRSAESAKSHIEGLLDAKIGGHHPYAENAAWASNQRPRIVKHLASIGLVAPRQVEVAAQPKTVLAPTLDDWFSQYIKS